MNLMHYAAMPVTLNRARTYHQGEPHSCGKPVGLWVSVEGDDDWPAWCQANEYGVGCLEEAHKVTLKSSANITLIQTPEQLDAFHATYAEEDEVSRSMRDYPFSDPGFAVRQWALNWGKVATTCDGIIITPYLWERRLFGPSWYYGWDCASGCIWNLDAIDTFEAWPS